MVGHTRTLPIDENLARRVDGLEGDEGGRPEITKTFRDFIRAAESILGLVDIYTEEPHANLSCPGFPLRACGA